MPVTSVSDIMKSSSLWMIALLCPVLILLINNNVSRSILFTLYPIILAGLTRTGPFWVDKIHILGVSFVVGAIYVLINATSVKVREAIRDPNTDKVRAGFIFGGLSVATVSILAISGIFTNLYRDSNFSA